VPFRFVAKFNYIRTLIFASRSEIFDLAMGFFKHCLQFVVNEQCLFDLGFRFGAIWCGRFHFQYIKLSPKVLHLGLLIGPFRADRFVFGLVISTREVTSNNFEFSFCV
jgi:hypothetical protein